MQYGTMYRNLFKAGTEMPLMELKAGVRQKMRDNAPNIFFVSIVFIIIGTVISELQFRVPDTVNAINLYLENLAAGKLQNIGAIYSYFRPSGVPLAIILWLLYSVIDAGYMSYCLKISRGLKSEYKDIFNGFLFMGKVLLIKIVTTILTVLWTFLFFFPGIAAFYRYRQSFYILIDDPQKGALQCIRESKRLMRGKKLDLFLLDLSFIGWWALDTLVVYLIPLPFSLPIVSIYLTPYHGLTCAAYYDRLINQFIV